MRNVKEDDLVAAKSSGLSKEAAAKLKQVPVAEAGGNAGG